MLCVAALVGGMIGALINTVFFHYFSTSNPLLGLWLSIALCAIGTSVLSMVFFDHALIIGSTIMGSYVFIRGISAFAGGFPNEFILYEDIINNTLG